MKRPTNADQVSRLMNAVVVTDAGCWEYQGQRDPKGYGRISFYGVKRLAHRMSWTLRYGDPGDLCVLHHCDNPPCVNPAHLFLGTVADNNADMMAKGRVSHAGAGSGEDHPLCRLSDADVAEIRRAVAAGATQRETATRFGVTQSHVWRLVHNLNRV